MRSRGNETSVGRGWWNRFRARHPEVTVRKGQPLSKCRMAATDRQSINEYFDLLEDTLTKNGITDKPANIFDCDETGMQLDHRAPRVVVPLTQKHPYTVTSGCKTQITVLACVSAAGYAIPPFVIYDRKSLNVEWTANEVPGTAYGLSERGWIDSELFMGWFYHHFLMHAPKARPLLLLIDGHASHYNPAVIEKATEESIILSACPQILHILFSCWTDAVFRR